MKKVYYQSKELIIVHHLRKTIDADGLKIQNRLIGMLGGDLRTIYDAHEIWMYNPATARFDSYKNKGDVSLLKAFFADKGINIRCDAASLSTANPIAYRFTDDKDHFLFNLKFGK